MSELKGACIIGQSGGPTSVINASAYGVIRTALDSGCITNVYGAEHGIKGVLEDRLFDMSQEDPKELELLKYTPSSALGSCRYKMKDPDEDDTDYKRILEVFKKHDVRYFFYNGGNDSMDTCNKISKYMQKVGQDDRQRPLWHRPLPRLRQRRQVHRDEPDGGLSGRARLRHGHDLHCRDHGPPRRLADCRRRARDEVRRGSRPHLPARD
jgi:6-phosphofructokinase